MSFVFLNYKHISDAKRYKYAVKSHVSGTYRRSIKRKDVRKSTAKSQSRSNQAKRDDDELELVQSRPVVQLIQRGSSEELAMAAWNQSRISIHSLCFEGTRVDPFGIYPIEGTKFVKEGLDFYDQVYVSSQEPLFAISISSNPHREWVLPIVMQNADSCHASVALTWTLKQLWSMRVDPNVNAQIAYHRHAAISEIRRNLDRGNFFADTSALITVVILASLDLLAGDVASFFNHWRGLRLMIESRGGLDNLGREGKVKAALMQYDLCFMLLTHSSTSMLRTLEDISADAYPQHPFHPEILHIVERLPLGFQELALQGRLCVDVLKILQRAQMPFSVRHGIPVDVDLYVTASTLHHSSAAQQLEKCICFTIVLFEHITFSKERSPTMAFRGIRKELTDSLPYLEWSSEIERECIIWMWAVLVESWRHKKIFLPEGVDLQRKLVTRFPDTARWPTLGMILSQFFWNMELFQIWSVSWEPYINAPILPPLMVQSLPTPGAPSNSAASTSPPAPSVPIATSPLQLPFHQSLTSPEAVRAQTQAAASLVTPPQTPPPQNGQSPTENYSQTNASPSTRSPVTGLTSYVVSMR